jgi:hypothetical protein
MVNSTILIRLFLSRRDGGWRKTLKVLSIKIVSPRQKFGSVSLSDLEGYFKDLPEKQIPLGV